MDAPAELISSPEAISQNWGGYSARVCAETIDHNCIKQGRHLGVAPAGLSSGTAAVITAAAGASVATWTASA